MENKTAFNEEISRTSPTCTINSNDDRKIEDNEKILETGGSDSIIETIVILEEAAEAQQVCQIGRASNENVPAKCINNKLFLFAL